MTETNPIHIKICGITNLADAQYVSQVGAEYLGFIFYEKSPRYITPEAAAEIGKSVKGIRKVGVFVNESVEFVNKTADLCGLDFVQLHGDESPEYIKAIHKPVIKALRIAPGDTPGQIEAAAARYLNAARFLLFDTKSEKLWGGTGKTFEWQLLAEADIQIPFFVAGGINPGNIGEVVRIVKSYAVDVSGGVEKEYGIKDVSKIDALMNAVTASMP